MLKRGEWMTFSSFIFFKFLVLYFPESSIILKGYCDTKIARDKTQKIYGSCHYWEE